MDPTPASDEPADDARAMLDALAADNARLAARAVAPAPWYYPALAAAAAAMVGAPALEDSGFSIMVLGLAGLSFSLIAMAHRKQTGVAVRLGATPRSLALVVVVSVVVASLLVGSFVLANRGDHALILWNAGAALVVMLLGSIAADIVHRAELRHAR